VKGNHGADAYTFEKFPDNALPSIDLRSRYEQNVELPWQKVSKTRASEWPPRHVIRQHGIDSVVLPEHIHLHMHIACGLSTRSLLLKPESELLMLHVTLSRACAADLFQTADFPGWPF
jgi:hypothetical protein